MTAVRLLELGSECAAATIRPPKQIEVSQHPVWDATHRGDKSRSRKRLRDVVSLRRFGVKVPKWSPRL